MHSRSAAWALATAVAISVFGGRMSIAGDRVDFEPVLDFLKLPKTVTLGQCSAVDLDSQGRLYLFHRGKQPILCFDRNGKFIRSWGDDLIGKAHGLRIDADDNIWVTDVGHHMVFQFSPQGKLLLALGQTDRPGLGDNQFDKPTDVAFGPKGVIYVTDGYGNSRVMKFAKNGKFLASWGKPGKGRGEFNLPHGIWIDDRDAEPLVVVADRQFDRLQWFTLDGEHRRTQDGFLWPANLDTYEDLLLVPELVARVTLLGKNNEVLVHLGTDSERIVADKQESGKYAIRSDELRWRPGKFVHPHDACFDRHGNIFVAEWVATGRVSKLRRL